MRRALVLFLLLGLLATLFVATGCATSSAGMASRVAAPGESTESVESADPGDPYAALVRLAEQIEASAAIARGAEASQVPFGRGEGALHVLRLLRRAIDEEIAWADTRYPYFQAQDERYAKLALGNPDNLYLVTRVEDDAVYRISGRRGTTADFNIQLYQGYPGIYRPMTGHGVLGLEELEIDEDGSFEVLVGGPPREKNWLALVPGTRRITVRYTYGDWRVEEAGDLSIERLPGRGIPGQPIGEEVVAERIDATAGYLGDAVTGYLDLVDQVYSGIRMNTLRPMRRLTGDVGGLGNQYNATGRYQLRADQALIVTTRPSEARYQGFQIGTEWFESLDFVNQTTSLNTKQARLSSDGVYRFVVSLRDPGVANWLDASGAPQGQILLRWQGTSALGSEHEPSVELVAFEEVAKHFPGDEPRFVAEERRAQIAERQAAIERRYGLSRR